MSTSSKATTFATHWLPKLSHPLSNWPGHWFEKGDNRMTESTRSHDHVYIKQCLELLRVFDVAATAEGLSSTDYPNREHIRLDAGFEKPWLTKYTNPFAAALPLKEPSITFIRFELMSGHDIAFIFAQLGPQAIA